MVSVGEGFNVVSNVIQFIPTLNAHLEHVCMIVVQRASEYN